MNTYFFNKARHGTISTLAMSVVALALGGCGLKNYLATVPKCFKETSMDSTCIDLYNFGYKETKTITVELLEDGKVIESKTVSPKMYLDNPNNVPKIWRKFYIKGIPKSRHPSTSYKNMVWFDNDPVVDKHHSIRIVVTPQYYFNITDLEFTTELYKVEAFGFGDRWYSCKVSDFKLDEEKFRKTKDDNCIYLKKAGSNVDPLVEADIYLDEELGYMDQLLQDYDKFDLREIYDIFAPLQYIEWRLNALKLFMDLPKKPKPNFVSKCVKSGKDRDCTFEQWQAERKAFALYDYKNSIELLHERHNLLKKLLAERKEKSVSDPD